MKKYRLIRDFALLLTGAAVLFGLFTLVNMFGSKTENNSRSDVSNARRVAELSQKRRNWPSAIAGNQKLIEQDPYDGHARWFRAASHRQLTMEVYRDLDDLKKQSGPQNEIDTLQASFKEKAEEACVLYSECLDFARYRNRSRASIALMHMLLGNTEKSLDFLELAVNDGYYNRQYSLGAFDLLRSQPRFRAINQQENRNRQNAIGNKLPQVFIAK